MDLTRFINLDNLNDEQHALAEIIGIERYISLIKTFGGTYIYIPLEDTLTKSIRNSVIKTDSSKMTISQLARKYGLSQSSIEVY